MSILNKQEILDRFDFWEIKDWQWYKENIPFFDCPDNDINSVYYYRWEIVRRHLKYIEELDSYIFTEFSTEEPLYWAGAYNTIICAADRHISETRWLKNQRYAKDYCRFWATSPRAQTNNYSNALANTIWSAYLINNDKQFAVDLLDDLIANHYRWVKGKNDYPNDDGYDSQMGLFWNTGRNSSGEYNLASAQLNEPLRGIQGYKIRGGAGYRPDINADMYSDVLAISNIAELAGRNDIACDYRRKAELLKKNIQSKLWDSNRNFFMHRWKHDEYSEADKYGKPSIKAGSFIWETNADRFGGIGFKPEQKGIGKGRELVGYIPWYYNLPDDCPEYAKAWDYMLDSQYFKAPFGPTTAEQNDPWFGIAYDCRTNGNSFPLTTSRVLTAAANFLNDYSYNGSFTKADYIEILNAFTKTHLSCGRPYVAELHHPFEDRWTVDRPIGQHYFHSSYCDLIITGLVGLRPQYATDTIKVCPIIPEDWDYFALTGIPYHSNIISIVWDRTGKKYGMGKGLSIVVNNGVVKQSDSLQFCDMPAHELKPAYTAN